MVKPACKLSATNAVCVALYNTYTFHSPSYLQVRPMGYTSEKLHKQL